MDKLIGFILEKGIYRILLLLKGRGYAIPVDTTAASVDHQHGLVNMICFFADLVCAVLIVYGWQQRTVTYISLLTIALYTFVDQYKIYSSQWAYLVSSEYVCKIRQRKNKYIKQYTPSLVNMIIAFAFVLILFVMSGMEISGFYELQKENLYRWFILFILAVLMYIKMKYIFLDTFIVEEFTYKKVGMQEDN